jgi:hypothetical protein
MKHVPLSTTLSDRDPTAPSTIASAAKVTGGALVLWAGVQLAATLLEKQVIAMGMVQAVLAEWAAGHLGIAWSHPLDPIPTSRQLLGRAARGGALGGATALAVVAAAAATHQATAVRVDSVGLGLLGVGLLTSMLAAVRDELILRGTVLRATRALAPRWVSLLACGMAAAAARFGADWVVGVPLVAEALRGIALAALWVYDRGVWMAWAANASWMWTLGSLVHGGVLDVRFAAEPDSAPCTMVVLGIVAMAAAVSRRPARSGLR